MKEFDIAVIGGGPGGYVAAIRAAQAGACVCLIEKDRVGGTCLNRGCIPTKALYSTARTLEQISHASQHGISCSVTGFDYAQAAKRKDDVVDRLVGGVAQLLKSAGVEIFSGEAFIEGENRIAIRRSGVTGHIKAKNIIIATGSVPAVPSGFKVDGVKVITSDHLLQLQELPKRLLVVGGGYIGSEFASIFATLGSKVTVVEQLPRLLMQTDRQIVREVEKSMKEKGVDILTSTEVKEIRPGDDSVTVVVGDGDEIVVDTVLISVGRRANSAGLGLENCGVKEDRGSIQVSDSMQTSVKGIYAIGDVTGGIQLAHVASYQAGIAVANALGGDRKADYRVVPSAIFTLPEIGQVGIGEEECKRLGIPCQVGRFMYQSSGKALCEGEPAGTIKIFADNDGEILGAAVVGIEASTLISEIALAMHNRIKVSELAEVIHAHPTLPEMVMEAAEDVHGLAVHKPSRKLKKTKK